MAEQAWDAVRAVVASSARGSDWPRIRELLAAYAVEVLHWRRVFNLTAARDEESVVGVHLIDGCAAAVAADCADGERAVDMGAGAGYVGIAAAVLYPQVRMLLVEARIKRAVFLERCVGRLGLANVRVRQGRLERLVADEPELAGGVDVCFARALAGMETVLDYARPLLGPGGRLVMNSAVPRRSDLPAGWEMTATLSVRGLVGVRHVVVVGCRKGVEEEPVEPE